MEGKVWESSSHMVVSQLSTMRQNAAASKDSSRLVSIFINQSDVRVDTQTVEPDRNFESISANTTPLCLPSVYHNI